MRAADAVREIARAKGAKPGQIALAWLLHKGDDTVPIPGTKRRTYLEENVAAADIRLTAEDMSRLDEALRPEAVSGPRTPDGNGRPLRPTGSELRKMRDLTGKVAVITGASSANGEAAARLLVAEGVSVVLACPLLRADGRAG
jgi:hypothetical protein